MKNLEIARILYEIAEMLEVQEVAFKPQAYRKAARNIETLSKDIQEIADEGRLKEIPGVGESIAEKVEEYLDTGQIKYFKELKKKMPYDIEGMGNIEGLGPKTINLLYRKLGTKTVEQLKKAAQKGKIRQIKGLGPKTEENILKRMAYSTTKRFVLGFILPEAEELKEYLKQGGEVEKVELAGSIRRRKETIGDLDILVISKDHKKTMERFVHYPDVKDILGQGNTKSSIILKNDVHVDLRVVENKSFGAAMQYFTGNKDHNILLRRIAIEKGCKLNEYGLFKGKKYIAGKNEKEIYNKLGLQYIPPEMRTNTGELELAKKKKIPKLIELKDIQGDLHVHSNYSDGSASIKEIALTAKKLGYKYIAITDHHGKVMIANPLDTKRLKKQFKEIDKVNKQISGLTILKGAEVDVVADGSLLINEKIRKELDVVVASVHSKFKMDKESMTDRIIKAMDSAHIIGHPTGRLLNKREGYDVNINRLAKAAKEKKVFLEINSWPERSDLNGDKVREANKVGCKFSIDTDSHAVNQLKFMALGVSIARRAGLTKNEVINTYSLDKLKKHL